MTGGEVTRESIEAEFPGWHAWQGADHVWHARLGDNMPPVAVHGEDLAALRDQIRLKLSRIEDRRWRTG
jgi:hypothetical protein